MSLGHSIVIHTWTRRFYRLPIFLLALACQDALLTISCSTISDKPCLDLSALETLGRDNLRITGEHVDGLIAPSHLVAGAIFGIENDALDGFRAGQSDGIAVDLDVEFRVFGEGEVFPRFGPVGISCQDRAVGVEESGLDDDRSGDFGIGSPDRLACSASASALLY